MRWIAAGVMVCFGGLAAVGYWKTQTQAWLQVVPMPAGPGAPSPRAGSIGLVFMDSGEKPLAGAQLDPEGILEFEGEFARCGALARSGRRDPAALREWQECFDGISHWTAGWGGRVRGVEVRLPNCPPRRIVTGLDRNADGWWIWWLPWPHGGPSRYAIYSLGLQLDFEGCGVHSLASHGANPG